MLTVDFKIVLWMIFNIILLSFLSYILYKLIKRMKEKLI